MAKFNVADAKQKLNEKLGEYGDEINNEDVFNYIYFLVYQRKKTKEDLLNDLNIFFQDKTQDFVYWTSSSRYHQEKPVKCRFFPNCTNSNCVYFHPTQKVIFN